MIKFKSEQEIKKIILDNIKYYHPRTEFKENNVDILKTGLMAMEGESWDTGDFCIIFNVEISWENICKLPSILNMYIRSISPHKYIKQGSCFVLHCVDKGENVDG